MCVFLKSERVWSHVFHVSSSVGSQRCICFCSSLFHLLQKLSVGIIVPPPFPVPQADCQGLQPCNILRHLKSVLNENHWFAVGPGLAQSFWELEGKLSFSASAVRQKQIPLSSAEGGEIQFCAGSGVPLGAALLAGLLGFSGKDEGYIWQTLAAFSPSLLRLCAKPTRYHHHLRCTDA